MTELACPQCRNNDVRRFSLLHKQGSSATTSTTRGFGFGTGGVGIGKASTKGVQVSQLASETAPPLLKRPGVPFFIAIIAALGLLSSFTGEDNAAGGFGFFLIILLVSGTIAYKRLTFNRETYPKLKAIWESSYMCMRCGNTFQSWL